MNGLYHFNVFLESGLGALGEAELDMYAHNGFLNFVHCDLIVGSFGELSTK